MSAPEARSRAVYDHDADDPRAARRRRPVADWGVGEDSFDLVPGRRFARRGDHAVPRGNPVEGRRTLVIGEDAELPPLETARTPGPDEDFATREAALRDRALTDALWDGDEPFAVPARERRDDEPFAVPARESRDDDPYGGITMPVDARNDRPAGARAAGEHVRGGQGGRKTVRIGGRPGEAAFAPSPRRRAPRTVGERVGARPDRVALWAFVLGLLLILIAVATASAEAATALVLAPVA